MLTGGSSTRMGTDKATLQIGGTSLAERSAQLLSGSVDTAIEVGEGVSGLHSVLEEPRGAGPLGAIVAGYRELTRRGLSPSAPCLVLACDLPLLDPWVLERIVRWPSEHSVLPVVDHLAQPLCARWSPWDLARARAAFDEGQRSLAALPDRNLAILVDEGFWGDHSIAFSDVDAPADLVRLGLVGDDLSP